MEHGPNRTETLSHIIRPIPTSLPPRQSSLYSPLSMSLVMPRPMIQYNTDLLRTAVTLSAAAAQQQQKQLQMQQLRQQRRGNHHLSTSYDEHKKHIR